ncbi:tandem-95 repeat protein [Wenzhouxiangella marina]|uniref:Uncharacterized protein n=1 Tax=Wenzhouxiangella marina TaxID=1579979 RepID=A0A0K0XVB4_9GAMM|nr:Ig-like domain-containing protein [Wenzhouxiangella marina]AKS41561.1 hypothetical protein WM2015_1187 [Wenzhouxiangella marina]MBB6086680.1 hypothetical protein [Wenzhouxiangella marina]
MSTSVRFRILFVLFALLSFGAASAQTLDFEVLIDTDNDAATGCAVVPTGGGPLGGFEQRLQASVNPVTLEVVALERAACAGSGFGTAAPVPGFPTPYPLALNAGLGGADAIELAVARSALVSTNAVQVRLAFIGDNGTGSDVLETIDGGPGGPILFGLPFEPVAIPTLTVLGLALMALILLGMATLAQRRLGRTGTLMAVMLVAGSAWAMSFLLDGDVSDWNGLSAIAQDPTGDATDSSSAIDLVAAFASTAGDEVFFRIDVVDVENLAPTAAADAYSTDEDTALNVAAPGVLANDSDPEADPLNAILATGPSNAQSFTLNPDGSFDYLPGPDFNGSDSFSYLANDGQSDSNPATVTLTINPVNDPPVASDDLASTDENTQVVIDVLANDSDIDGNPDPATVTITAAPGNGSTSVDPITGAITYTPAADFNGSDSLSYEVCDDGTPTPAACATANVAITIVAVNDAPSFTASNPPAVNEDAGAQTVNGWVTNFDPGPNEGGQSVLAYLVTGVSDPSLFSAAPSVDVAGNLSYTPAPNASGTSTFDVAVQDDGGTANGGTDTSPVQTFTITVNPLDDAPLAVDDTATVNEDDSAQAIDVLANDVDIDGGPISIAMATQPANGTVVIIGGGSGLTYQPDPDACNDGSPTDDFSYTLAPGGSTATVAVTVVCVNDPPTVSFPTAGASFDAGVGPVTLDPAATLTDIDSNQFNRVEATLDIGGTCDPLDTLTIENQGGGAGQIGFDGSTVSFEGTPISTLVQAWACLDAGTGTQTPFRVDLDTNADQIATEALLRALQFTTSSGDTTARIAQVSVADDDNATGSAAQIINIDRAPVAVADTLDVALGSVDSSLSVLSNDDPGAPAAVVDVYADSGDIGGASQVVAPGLYTHPIGGFTVSIQAGGSLTVDATAGGVSAGSYAFDYQITNASGSSVATVTIDIVEAPAPRDDDLAVVIGNVLNVDLTADNGSGVDNIGTPPFTSLSFGAGDLGGSVTDNPAGSTIGLAGGTLNIDSLGTLDLTGATTTGDYSFQYQLSNSVGSGIATVTIQVQAIPVANADSFNVAVGDPLTLPAGALFADNGFGADDRGSPLANVQSFGGGDLGGTVTSNPAGSSTGLAGGALSVFADGSLTLSGTSTAGSYSFDYRLANAAGSSDATITIVVEQAPTANDDLAAAGSTPGDAFHTALDVALAPADGSPEDLDSNDVLGTPAATIASFGTIQTNDGSGGFNPPFGTVTSNAQGTTVSPLPNYASGSLVVNANGTYNFTPPTGYVGLFAFEYRLSNSVGSSDALVTLAVGNRPSCTADTFTGTANIDFDINSVAGVLANDSGSNITVTQSMGSAANVGSRVATTNGGFVTLNANGSFNYSPPAGVAGASADSFSYAISNGFGQVTANCTATVSLNTDGGTIAWFIDRGGVGNNLGTFADPFLSIAAFNAVNDGTGNNPADGDVIYVFNDFPGFYNEADGFNLRSGQSIYGGTVQFDTVYTATGSTSAAYNSFAASAEGNPTQIRTTGDDAFDIASNNTVRGFWVDSTAGYAFADSGVNIGTTTISDVSTFNNGGVFNLQNGGTINATLGRMSSSVSSDGVSVIALNGISGTITDTTPGGIIYNANGNVFDIRNSTASLTVSSPVIRGTGSGAGLFLSNADGTISFGATFELTSGTAGISIENGSDGSLTISDAGSSIRSIQGVPFRVNSSTMAINYAGNITHTVASGSNIAFRTIEIVGGSGPITFGGAIITGANPAGQLATAETIYLENTGTANVIAFNYVDSTTLGVPAIASRVSGNVAMNRFRVLCDGDLGPDNHCIDISDTTSSGFTVESLYTRHGDAGESGGAISLTNTPGVWTIEDVSNGLNGRNGPLVFGNNFGTLNIGTVNSPTSPGAPNPGPFTVDAGPALDLTGGVINIRSSNLQAFNSVNGIRLTNTTGVGLNVLDGQIPNSTGDAVRLTSAENVTLNSFEISGSDVNGIFGQTVTNFTLSNSLITNNGDAVDEGGLRFEDLLGAATISNTTISGSAEHNIEITNVSGTLSPLTISNSTLSTNSAVLGADGLLLETRNSASADVIVTGSTFLDNRSDGIQINALDNSEASLTVDDTDFLSTLDASPGGSVAARGIVLSAATSARISFDIGTTLPNLFENFSPNVGEEAINLTLVSTSTNSALLSGRINNNTFINSGGAIGIDGRGDGAMVLEIDGNTANTTRQAIDGIIGDALGDAATADLTITNNSLTVSGTAANPNNEAIGWLGDRDTVTCMNVRGNTGVASGTRDDILLDDFTDPGGAMLLESGVTDCGGACANSEAHLLATNTITDAFSTAALVTPGSCTVVP